jgi:hypothetical protein
LQLQNGYITVRARQMAASSSVGETLAQLSQTKDQITHPAVLDIPIDNLSDISHSLVAVMSSLEKLMGIADNLAKVGFPNLK